MSHQPQIRSNSLRDDDHEFDTNQDTHHSVDDTPGRGFVVPFGSPAASKIRASPPFIGESRVVKELFSVIDRVSKLDNSVLITGATGTGKELIRMPFTRAAPGLTNLL